MAWSTKGFCLLGKIDRTRREVTKTTNLSMVFLLLEYADISVGFRAVLNWLL